MMIMFCLFNIIDFMKLTAPLSRKEWQGVEVVGEFLETLREKPNIAVAKPTYNHAGFVQLCAEALNNTIDSNGIGSLTIIPPTIQWRS